MAFLIHQIDFFNSKLVLTNTILFGYTEHGSGHAIAEDALAWIDWRKNPKHNIQVLFTLLL